MSRLIIFVFCIAFLVLAGGGVKFGMALMAAVFALLVGYVGYLALRMFLSSPHR